ncbi:MAG: NAD-dependent deacylase [Bacteroidota bacterium]|nr:NAD-dependent deacylase [Bacteroidota bacterium]
MPKKIVVLSGAGISAESGIATFRDSNGLWEGHDIIEVASPQGWNANHELVLNFYNLRRSAARMAKPNLGHQILADLEKDFEVVIVTQNVDDLHERAGSKNVIHLHGELCKARSCIDENLVYEIPEGASISLGDLCEKGSQLRPHIVWFGEMVPMMEMAVQEALTADIFIVAGTSLLVYPAAGLVDYVPDHAPIFVIDPKMPSLRSSLNLYPIEENATSGLKKVADILRKEFL